VSAPIAVLDAVSIGNRRRGFDIVEEVSLTVTPGEILGVVGESGSGKSTLALSLLGFARRGLTLTHGTMRIGGHEIWAPSAARTELRGKVVSYVPQDAAAALNPSMTLDRHLREVLRAHGTGAAPEQEALIVGALEAAQLPTDAAFRRRYPHQLSGGQQQRFTIAVAMVNRPALLVMDEPTTGLDVLTQAEVAKTVRQLCRERRTAVIFVSHDLSLLGQLADRLAVVYAGRVVELGATAEIVERSQHPYTTLLLRAVPDPAGEARPVGIAGSAPRPWRRPAGCRFADRCPVVSAACRDQDVDLRPAGDGHLVRCLHPGTVGPAATRPTAVTETSGASGPRGSVLAVEHLNAAHGGHRVVHDVSFTLEPGGSLALVGESGSGKTTLARAVAGLHSEFTGRVTFGDADLSATRPRSRELQRRVQYIFQNAAQALNPRRSIGASMTEPILRFFGASRQEAARQVGGLLEQVGLGAEVAAAMPRDLSGGERQRVAIARALAARPDLLVCDEVTSSLDVSVQAAIVELLADLQQTASLSLLFITHNLPLSWTLCHDVIVLKQGEIVEAGPTTSIVHSPSHPYTRRLIEAGTLQLHEPTSREDEPHDGTLIG